MTRAAAASQQRALSAYARYFYLDQPERRAPIAEALQARGIAHANRVVQNLANRGPMRAATRMRLAAELQALRCAALTKPTLHTVPRGTDGFAFLNIHSAVTILLGLMPEAVQIFPQMMERARWPSRLPGFLIALGESPAATFQFFLLAHREYAARNESALVVARNSGEAAVVRAILAGTCFSVAHFDDTHRFFTLPGFGCDLWYIPASDNLESRYFAMT